MTDILKLNSNDSIDIQIENDSILSDGYGISPKYLMKNPEIPIQSKAIYAYLASYTGNKKYCHPTIETICKDLNINRSTLNKYLKILKEKGFIRVYRIQNEDNLYKNNVYEIVMSKSQIKNNTNHNHKDDKKNEKSPEEVAPSTSDMKEKILNKIHNNNIIAQKEKDIQVLKESGFTEIEIYSMSEEEIKQTANTAREIIKKQQKK
ncbi:helix-turn-helix domain-containing protein [Clostridioides sp. ZZV14-6345]|uniref:helix-turn-helix domain-containing protein n=1 Tax=Clostridioides sp. ZZV14-6345 TaxID=2811496 RepID=UPI001D12B4CD|nr:helix-turn-helix domain-containing protein [Clostridioides sp. ZZV14-6345]